MRTPSRRFRRLFFLAVATSVVAAAAACGDRTGLLIPDEVTAAPDARADVFHGFDAQPPEEDAQEEDALPPIDVIVPVDAPNDCPDAGSTLVYLITYQTDLFSFYPPTASFRKIGAISCPTQTPASPFSMAVDRNGLAYVLFDDGELFEVSTATAACKSTPFRPGSGQGFTDTFGMGFSKNVGDAGETLYIASEDAMSKLGHIDTTTFGVTVDGIFNPTITQAELTGTGAGQLFAFYPDGNGTAIGQIDQATARVVGQATFPNLSNGTGWAFAFWGGDFYIFTAPVVGPGGPNPSVVTRYRPSDGSLLPVAQIADEIVGAGVSTCAPQR